MNSLTSLFVLVLASCMVFMSAGVPCTPATCPPGPVRVTFQYSNCTGEMVYASDFTAADFECQNDGTTTSWITTYDSTGMYYYNGINNLDCDLTLPNASYSVTSVIFGVCVAEIARMYLPSVNSSFVSPQEPQALGNPKNLTAYTSIENLPCYGPHNCTREDGTTPEIIETTYSQAGNCSTGVSSAYSTAQFGVCYYFTGTLYVSPTCTTDHGYGYLIFVDDNCQKLFQTEAAVFACSNTEDSYGIQCTSPIAPVTPPPPSSSSASLSLSIAPLAVILAFILVFV